jgi:hypothetical protein
MLVDTTGTPQGHGFEDFDAGASAGGERHNEDFAAVEVGPHIIDGAGEEEACVIRGEGARERGSEGGEGEREILTTNEDKSKRIKDFQVWAVGRACCKWLSF